MIIQQITPIYRSPGVDVLPLFNSLKAALAGMLFTIAGCRTEETAEMQDCQARFSELYEKHVKKIYTFHYLKTGNVQDAEDLTSQTFMEALEGLSRYTEEGHFLAWIYSIARNKNADFYRKKKPLLPLFFLEKRRTKFDDPEITVQSNIQLERIIHSLHDIGEEKAEAIILRIFCRLDAEETGRILGKSAPAVRMLVYRGVKELRLILKDELQEEK